MLATVLGVEIAYIAVPKREDQGTLKTLAFYKEGRMIEDFEYLIEGTPCEQILRSGYSALPDHSANDSPTTRCSRQWKPPAMRGFPSRVATVPCWESLRSPPASRCLILSWSSRC